MEDSDELPGPDPDSLEVVEEAPEGINPIPMRITYTSDSVSDYVALTRSGWQVTLDLADPLLGVVRSAASLSVKIDELRSALAAIGIEGIIEHFTSVVARYTNELLPVDAIPESIGLGGALYLLVKLRETSLLTLRHIHQASIDEWPQWNKLFINAEKHPDINVG